MSGLGSSMSFYRYGSYSPTRLSNGDVANGEMRTVLDEKAMLATDAGEFELPMERITTVEVSGIPSTKKALGRLQLRDGSVLHVGEFRREADSRSAKSAALGELKFTAADVAELIVAPAALRLPAAPSQKKVEPEAAKVEEKAVDLKIEVTPQ